jgi:HAD superfamily hydrolase (TIGR01509 family)
MASNLPTSRRVPEATTARPLHTRASVHMHVNAASTPFALHRIPIARRVSWFCSSERACPRAARVCAAAGNRDLPEALLFDCDGVLVDTEAEGHRIAFNEAFARFNLPHMWSLEEYGRLLEIGGGKERMNFYFSEREEQEPWASVKDAEERKAFLKKMHEAKTDMFNKLIETGKLPVRPGVIRLINEAIDAGVKVAVCSTSNERAVSNIVRVMLGDRIAQHMRVFAGDVVPKKKPAPDVYLLAAKELSVEPANCVVIEDSKIGLAAGKAAGMRVVVTESYYTKGEDFSVADAVYDCIGDAGDERFSLSTLSALESATV